MNLSAEVQKTAAILQQLRLHPPRSLQSFQGNYPGKFFGSGDEKNQISHYQPGDDVRFIDWQATAKMGTVQVNKTAATEDLEIWIVLDISPRMRLGSTTRSKKEQAISCAIFLALFAQQENSKVGCVLMHGDRTQVLASTRAQTQMVSMLSEIEMLPIQTSGSCNINEALKVVQLYIKRKSFVALLSDFISPKNWEQQLCAVAQKHTVAALQVTDPRDEILPNVGRITVADPATGAQIHVATQRRSIRKKFSKAAQVRQQQLIQTLQRCGVEHLQLSTEENHLDVLVPFFQSDSKA